MDLARMKVRERVPLKIRKDANCFLLSKSSVGKEKIPSYQEQHSFAPRVRLSLKPHRRALFVGALTKMEKQFVCPRISVVIMPIISIVFCPGC